VITAVSTPIFVAVIGGQRTWRLCGRRRCRLIRFDSADGAVIGAYADLRAAKKRLLSYTVGCVIATALLAFTGPGTLALAVGWCSPTFASA